MTNRYLPTDTYYRGYRLSTLPNGVTRIFFEDDDLGCTTNLVAAKRIVDVYHNAR